MWIVAEFYSRKSFKIVFALFHVTSDHSAVVSGISGVVIVSVEVVGSGVLTQPTISGKLQTFKLESNCK